MNVNQPEYAIYASYSYGPYFGYQDLFISSDSNYGFSNLGYVYQLPSSFVNNSANSYSLAGNTNFEAVEIEVFSIYVDRELI